MWAMGLASSFLQVDDYAALAAVYAHETAGQHAPGVAVGGLDLDNVGAQVGQLAAYAGAGQHGGEICYPDLL